MATMSTIVRNMYHEIRHDPVILPLACACLAVHGLLTVLFQFAPQKYGPWKPTALYSAKQIVTLGLMTLQTYWGFQAWWFDDAYHSRIHPPALLVEDERDSYPAGIFLSQVVVGGLLQDIPLGIIAGGVDIVMQVHHVGMFVVATIALGYWSSPQCCMPVMTRYAPFFFGVIELSSIPLAIVDVFHPHKQPLWYDYHLTWPALQTLNQVSRYSFAALYVLVRMMYFPAVILGQVVPDGWAKLQYSLEEEQQLQDTSSIIIIRDNQAYRGPIWTILIFAILFSLLQMYWGTLILKQVAKALNGGGDDSKNTKEEETTTTTTKKQAKVKAV